MMELHTEHSVPCTTRKSRTLKIAFYARQGWSRILTIGHGRQGLGRSLTITLHSRQKAGRNLTIAFHARQRLSRTLTIVFLYGKDMAAADNRVSCTVRIETRSDDSVSFTTIPFSRKEETRVSPPPCGQAGAALIFCNLSARVWSRLLLQGTSKESFEQPRTNTFVFRSAPDGVLQAVVADVVRSHVPKFGTLEENVGAIFVFPT
ncbi:hypothetical protein PoB_000675500 [Plakobranchus ocellatus]|uniref:Uncharacterized protein n=1 Tax=Plakobranchus ocellatus TaxID=259542 RepID=A0AAV3YBW9_9GAST|nr:hypothetical protein PoB_000675500 [Plakobranchus ocellatus]